MQEITLKGKNYLLVEVPDKAEKVDYWNNNTIFKYLGVNINKLLSEKAHKIIGKISHILKDEDICKELVEFYDYKESNKWFIELIMWKDYNFQLNEEELFDFDFARDSFLSYLQSINLDLTKNWILIKIL